VKAQGKEKIQKNKKLRTDRKWKIKPMLKLQTRNEHEINLKELDAYGCLN